MPNYHFLVVHLASAKYGRGESVWEALEQAIGKKECMRFMTSQPSRGFYWSPLQPRTLGSTSSSRRTVQHINKTYEINAVYMNNPIGPAKDKTMLLAIYRSISDEVLDHLPNDNELTQTSRNKKSDKKNRK